MAIFSNLASLKTKQEAFDKRQADRDLPKATWFTIPKDGSALKIRFLQELDDQAENYDKKAGTFLGAVEHQAPGPKGFLSRALDTTETDPEGRDFAVEMLAKTGDNDWRARENFYINVAVERDGKVQPEIMSRNLHSTFVKTLVRKYERSGGKGITGRTFEIFKQGSGPQTQWILEDLNEDLDITGVEPWDLNTYAIREIPYDKQEEYYLKNYEPKKEESAGEGTLAVSGSKGSEDSGSGSTEFKW
ncbi:single strand DNA binding protein [Rhodococcus phage Trina]|uniref:SsDNA binding protein n=1 Tax=Rhodococcus phage Trina TaxID=2027905 RepID=A0A2D1ADJ5_9CAUD|nr:single strand DNA binding protein [Rhodococcus phage Trina]ASZ74914.1 ssDNA binding protein [Rhodococcus phage Trina]